MRSANYYKKTPKFAIFNSIHIMTTKRGFTTTLLHSDRLGKPEHGALHKPIHTSVTFGYDDVQDLVDVFQNKKKRLCVFPSGKPYRYSFGIQGYTNGKRHLIYRIFNRHGRDSCVIYRADP